jgi:hypothetical protein
LIISNEFCTSIFISSGKKEFAFGLKLLCWKNSGLSRPTLSLLAVSVGFLSGG